MRPNDGSDPRDRVETTDYIISVSDLMSGLLFVFIIVLAVYIMKYSETRSELVSAREVRTKILKEIESRIPFVVEIDTVQGIARLNAFDLFDSGHPEPSFRGKKIIKKVAEALSEILPRYLEPGPGKPRVSSVFIEGHTDDMKVDKKEARNFLYENNWDLSAKRAISTYKLMNKHLSKEELVRLDDLKNDESQLLFGVSGYGENRPLTDAPAEVSRDSDNATRQKYREDIKKWRTGNRRIDIRIIMASPKPDPVKQIEEATTANQ